MSEEMQTLFNITESITLLFVTVFRFYYLSMLRSFKRLARERKVDGVLAYFAMVTHEIPWFIAKAKTGMS